MNLRKRWFVVGPVIVLISIMLAPLLWQALLFLVIEPAAYYWWRANRILGVIPQFIYWLFWVICFGIIAGVLILKSLQVEEKQPSIKKSDFGPVQSLAQSIALTERSHYFRWSIANKLARLTLKILTRTPSAENLIIRYSPVDLSALDWHPPENIQNYLFAGLDSSLSNIHRKSIFTSKKPVDSHLDTNLNHIIDYLETLME
jgi:hypothetical protein